MRRQCISHIPWRQIALLCWLQLCPLLIQAQDKKPETILSPRLAEPVKTSASLPPATFHLLGVIDRTGNPRPLVVAENFGGINLDRTPEEIVRHAFTESLKTSGRLAPEEASADYLLTVYVFHFGLARGSGRTWPCRRVERL